MRSSRPQEADRKVLSRLVSKFVESATHPVWQRWRQKASKCYRYREGDQWTDQERRELRERGQPETVQNEVKPRIHRKLGQLIQTRVNMTYVGRNTPIDDEPANILADLSLFVDQDNLYEFKEAKVAKHGLTGGIGWLEMDVEEDETSRRRIYQLAENPFVMFPDPYFVEPDLSDCRYLHRAKWIDTEELIALVPAKEQQIRQLAHGHGYQVDADLGIDPAVRNDPMLTFVDRQKNRLRPVETWYRRKVKLFKVFTPEGSYVSSLPLEAGDVKDLKDAFPKLSFQTDPVIVDQMWKAIWCGGLLLYHEPWPRNAYPFVCFIADQKANGEPIGCDDLLPIQDAINKRKSKALNLLSNRRIIAEEGAIKDKEEAQIENAKADGFIEVEMGALSGQKVLLAENIEMGQGQMVLLADDKDAMDRVSGLPPEAMGQRSEVRSSAGIARKQQMVELVTTPDVQNFREYRHHKARLQLLLMREVFDEPMTFHVTDDPNKARYVALTKDTIQVLKERVYDVVLKETPDYLTVREQQLDMLFQYMPAVLQNPMLGKVMIALTDLREKDAILKMIDQAMQTPPAQPKMAMSFDWKELTPHDKVFFALQYLQAPAYAEVLAQQAGDPAYLAKLKQDLAKTMIKEGTRAQLERGVLDMSAYKTAMEGMMEARKLSMEQMGGMLNGASGNPNSVQPDSGQPDL